MSILESKEIQTICRVINFLVQLHARLFETNTHFAFTTTDGTTTTTKDSKKLHVPFFFIFLWDREDNF